jgi:hypothetical protein
MWIKPKCEKALYKKEESWDGPDTTIHDTWGQSMPPEESGEIRPHKRSQDWEATRTPRYNEQDWGEITYTPTATTESEMVQSAAWTVRCSTTKGCTSDPREIGTRVEAHNERKIRGTGD